MKSMLTEKDLENIKDIVQTEVCFVAKITKEGFDDVDRKFTVVNKKIDSLTTAVDGFAKNQEKFNAELAAERAARERLFGK